MPAKRKLSTSATADPVQATEVRPPRPKRTRTLKDPKGQQQDSDSVLVRGFVSASTDEDPVSDSDFDDGNDNVRPKSLGSAGRVAAKKNKTETSGKKSRLGKKALSPEEKAKEKAEKKTMTDLAHSSPVPVLPPRLGFKSDRSLRSLSKNSGRFYLRRIQFWSNHAPVYRVEGVRLNDLQSRPKGKTGKAAASAIASSMENEPADAGSMIILDDEGNRLACVFAQRKRVGEDRPLVSQVAEQMARRNGKKDPIYPGAKGRTYEDFSKLDEKNVAHDGIPLGMLKGYHLAVHELHSILPPEVQSADIRHPQDRVMAYGQVGDQNVYLERTGVTHLVHSWHQKGHPNKGMTQSADMHGRGSTTKAKAVVAYLVASQPVAVLLATMFEEAYPQYFKKYKAAFKKGVWRAEDPGPWLGRAIVWKLQVEFHRDGLDDGPAAIFSCGDFEGGRLYLPDLGVKLYYAPGDVVIFMAGALYHGVSKWNPGLKQEADNLTPGRIGNVFFFPRASYQKLAA